MTSRRAPDPRRVVRWYPRAWRERHGEVLLGTLAEQAEATGGPVLSRADARSMRVHGLAERLSPGVGAVLALAGAVVLVVGLAALVVGAGGTGPLAVLPGLLFVGVGPALLSLSAAALARDLGVTTAAQTLVAAAASVVAWGLATLASFSWGSGFRQADQGVEPSDFAAAFPWLFVGALVVGAFALAPVVVGVLRGVRRPLLRRGLAAGCVLPGVVVIGLLTLAPGSALLPALGLLLAWGLRWRVVDDRRGRIRPAVTAPAGGGPAPSSSRGVGDRPRRPVVGLAVATAVLGTPFALFAVLGGSEPRGPSWLPAAWAGLPPMNVGLAGGALASLPLVAALGLVAAHAWGRRGAVAGLLVGVAVVMSAVSASMGPVGDTQTYLLFLAGVLVGVAVVLPVVRSVPGPPVARWAVVGLVGLVAGGAVGFMAVAVLPLVAPVVAVVVAGVLARRPSRPAVAIDAREAAAVWPPSRA